MHITRVRERNLAQSNLLTTGIFKRFSLCPVYSKGHEPNFLERLSKQELGPMTLFPPKSLLDIKIILLF